MQEQFAALIAEEFGFPFTPMQSKATMALARFVLTPLPDCAFILRGYAGTGKTSLIGAFVRVMKRLERDVVLMAPTGRAAKVLAKHAGTEAHTIHKVIYRQQTFNGEGTKFSIGFNKLKNAIFIVDEASMIAIDDGGASIFGTGQLLDDLIRFVYEGTGCRLLLLGDTAQLPPVGAEESPALMKSVIEQYGLRVGQADLTEVVRQGEQSGVLSNATMLRQSISEEKEELPAIRVSGSGEVRLMPGDELIEALATDYQDYGTQDTIVITRSNKRANIFNNGIRAQILDREDQLNRGDLIMAVKNNYFWTERAAKELPKGERLPMDFIANGDTAEIVRIRNVHEQFGFRFADATLCFPDYGDFEIDCRVLLDTLNSESPSLTHEESQHLYEEVLKDYADIPQKKERMKKLREDPYYNALQIKYAYAITCHKAQGGQWARVYIDQGFIPPDTSRTSYIRWLYTAFTRTTDRVYLVNWPKEQTIRTDNEETQ